MIIYRIIRFAPIRLVLTAGGAAIITIAVFYLIQWLISEGEIAVVDSSAPNSVEFVRPEQPPEPPIEQMSIEQAGVHKVDRIVIPEPTRLDMGAEVWVDEGTPAIDADQVCGPSPLPLDLSMTSVEEFETLWMTDRQAFATQRILPSYPLIALAKRIEGWVELKFTVTRTGAVVDERIVRASHRQIFDLDSLIAIRQWKYLPRVVGGQNVDTPDVMVRFVFDLAGVKEEKVSDK